MRKGGKRWTIADVIAVSHGPIRGAGEAKPVTPAAPRKQKYRNTKVVQADGKKFDSKGEADRYTQLLQLAAMGQITELKRSVSFPLAPACDLGEKRRKPALRYVADFTYINADGQLVVEDYKSDITRKQPVYRMKKHLMQTVHGIRILETKKCRATK